MHKKCNKNKSICDVIYERSLVPQGNIILCYYYGRILEKLDLCQNWPRKDDNLGGNSQNFLGKFVRFFVT